MKRTWISVIPALVVIVVAILTLPRIHYQTRGILLPAKETLGASSPDQVILYDGTFLSNLVSKNYKILGYIRLARHYSPQTDSTVIKQFIVNEAQSKAASVGANAIFVRLFARSNLKLTPSVLATYTFWGVAAKVKR